MDTTTKSERIKSRIETLRAIKDGKKFSRADKVLRPLLFGDLISVTYFGDMIDQVSLTSTGETYLAFYEKQPAASL